MGIFDDFNLDPKFGDTLSADELEKLGKAHSFLSVLKTKYHNWQADPSNHASQGSIDAYIASVGAKAERDRQDAEALRNSFK